MYPEQFDYLRATSVDEALDLLEEHRDRNTELHAGGHSLLPTMKTRLANPDVLVDISHIDELRGIEATDGVLSVGALTRYADIVESDLAREHAPALVEAAAEIGDPQVRNRGTIGGNIAHADPASDLPAATLASEAVVTVRNRDGRREILIDEFFEGMYQTGLRDDDILTRVNVPLATEGTVGAYAKKPHPASGYAQVGVAATLRTQGDTIDSARVAANGVLDRGVRLSAVETTLEGERPTEETVAVAADAAGKELDTSSIMADDEVSRAYKQQLLTEYTRRALESATNRLSTPRASD